MSAFRYWSALSSLMLMDVVARFARADEANHDHAASFSAFPAFGELGFWTLLVFAGLLAVLTRFAWKPLAQALDDREKHIRNEREAAEQAHERAKALLAEHERKMAEVQNEVRGIIDAARRDAQTTQQEILKKAQADADSTRERAVREIEQAKDSALQELFEQAANVATEVAAKIVRKSLNPQDHRELVAQVIKELPSRN
jgi:F-type H+-transporting ATPase subunit b